MVQSIRSQESGTYRSVDGIPAVALDAYRRAAESAPTGCGLDWELLAAIGRIESNHGRFGGSSLDPEGHTTRPILGLRLDGRATARIADTDAGRLDGDTEFDRAVGPMQFIPATWAVYGRDGNADGRSDPQNIYDTAAAAAAYLCAAGGDLSSEAGRKRAVFAYNNSSQYVADVLALAERYAGQNSQVLAVVSAEVQPAPVLPIGPTGPVVDAPLPLAAAPLVAPVGPASLLVIPGSSTQPSSSVSPPTGNPEPPAPTPPATPRPAAPEPSTPTPPEPSTPTPTTPSSPMPTLQVPSTPTPTPTPAPTPTPGTPEPSNPTPALPCLTELSANLPVAIGLRGASDDEGLMAALVERLQVAAIQFHRLEGEVPTRSGVFYPVGGQSQAIALAELLHIDPVYVSEAAASQEVAITLAQADTAEMLAALSRTASCQ
ncbi:lytic transglycosylase domain-containing protein [Blastococcus aggregatus]|uniref:lytic transglycosylase domain-containing protein n=1 Tax=Blastococcus aggregatus TaxID=38502 RepID=UPI0015964C55|nr:lytic transglycosylase domain-containing protein [Blastococcus aggregatus]